MQSGYKDEFQVLQLQEQKLYKIYEIPQADALPRHSCASIVIVMPCVNPKVNVMCMLESKDNQHIFSNFGYFSMDCFTVVNTNQATVPYRQLSNPAKMLTDPSGNRQRAIRYNSFEKA